MSKRITAERLPNGSWFATWAGWNLVLTTVNNKWTTFLWNYDLAPQDDLRSFFCTSKAGFLTSSEAADWACQEMSNKGAVVKVFGRPSMTLKSCLGFEEISALEALQEIRRAM